MRTAAQLRDPSGAPRRATTAVWLAALVLACSSSARGSSAPGIATTSLRYTLDLARSELTLVLRKAGLASAFAHDHAVRASSFRGEAIFDPERPQAAAVTVTVDVPALIVDEPEIRRRHDLEGEMSDNERRRVQATMLSPRQLDAERFPEMTFRTTHVERVPEVPGRFRVTGELTLHGTTREVAFEASVTLGASGAWQGEAELPFLQSDFGIKPYRALLGAVKVADEVTLHLRLVATPHATPVATASSP